MAAVGCTLISAAIGNNPEKHTVSQRSTSQGYLTSSSSKDKNRMLYVQYGNFQIESMQAHTRALKKRPILLILRTSAKAKHLQVLSEQKPIF